MPNKSTFGLDDNLVSLLCYLPICAVNLIFSIASIVTEKNNKLVRFHAFQSLFLSIIFIVLFIATYVLIFVGVLIDSAIGVPIFTIVFGLIPWVVLLVFVVICIIAMIKAYGGQMLKLPIIGGFADKYSG